MEGTTLTILITEWEVLIKNIEELSLSLATANGQLERMAKMNADWVLKFHEQKTKVSQLERQIKELQSGLSS